MWLMVLFTSAMSQTSAHFYSQFGILSKGDVEAAWELILECFSEVSTMQAQLKNIRFSFEWANLRSN